MARVARVSAPREASWEFAEAYVAEDPVFATARTRAEEVGCTPIGAGGGAALRFLAALTDARSVVEVGTGTGVSALWMLRGMRSDGVLTSIDVEGDKAEYAAYLEEALRLLRPGGVVAFDNALWHDRVADPSQRDPETVALRGLVQAVREDERVVSVLLPVGDGLLAAIKRD